VTGGAVPRDLGERITSLRAPLGNILGGKEKGEGGTPGSTLLSLRVVREISRDTKKSRKGGVT